jgi:hypothetical protein
MHTVHEIVEEAKRLPVPERRRLIHEIESSLELEKDQEAAPIQPPSGAPSGSRYGQTLALTGSLHSDYRDVAGDKYKHLAEIYADNHAKVR